MTVEDVVARIDEIAVHQCPECDLPLGDGPSGFWCGERCQRVWQRRQAKLPDYAPDAPHGVYRPGGFITPVNLGWSRSEGDTETCLPEGARLVFDTSPILASSSAAVDADASMSRAFEALHLPYGRPVPLANMVVNRNGSVYRLYPLGRSLPTLACSCRRVLGMRFRRSSCPVHNQEAS